MWTWCIFELNTRVGVGVPQKQGLRIPGESLAIGVVCGGLGLCPQIGYCSNSILFSVCMSPSSKVYFRENLWCGSLLQKMSSQTSYSTQTKLIGLQLASKLYSLSFHDPVRLGDTSCHAPIIRGCWRPRDWVDPRPSRGPWLIV